MVRSVQTLTFEEFTKREFLMNFKEKHPIVLTQFKKNQPLAEFKEKHPIVLTQFRGNHPNVPRQFKDNYTLSKTRSKAKVITTITARALITKHLVRGLLFSKHRTLWRLFVQQTATLCLTLNDDSVINAIAKEKGIALSRLYGSWGTLWSDEQRGLVSNLNRLDPYQRVNYFLGLRQLTKSYLYFDYCQALGAQLPNDCNFQHFPHTWVMPREYFQLQNYLRQHPAKKLVRKPLILHREKMVVSTHLRENRGAAPTGSTNKLVFDASDKFGREELGRPCIVQVNIDNPFLIDGLKFTLSCFVLVTSLGDTPRVFVHREGEVGFYNVNNLAEKHSIDTMDLLWTWLHQNGHDCGEVVARIDHLIAMTMVAVNPHLTQEMKRKNIRLDGQVSSAHGVESARLIFLNKLQVRNPAHGVEDVWLIFLIELSTQRGTDYRPPLSMAEKK